MYTERVNTGTQGPQGVPRHTDNGTARKGNGDNERLPPAEGRYDNKGGGEKRQKGSFKKVRVKEEEEDRRSGEEEGGEVCTIYSDRVKPENRINHKSFILKISNKM